MQIGNIKINKMEINQFVYWLQGALELNPEMLEKGMTPEQVKTIQDHLNLVFKKVTPDRFDKVEESRKTPYDLNPYKPADILSPNPISGDRYCTPSAGYTSPSSDVEATLVAIC